MEFPEIIALVIIGIILFFASLYIYRSKKKGNKCIGCPYAKNCSKKNCDKSK